MMSVKRRRVAKDDAEGVGRGSKLRASMRKSWRKSFARLSWKPSAIDSDTKVLTDLDEATEA